MANTYFDLSRLRRQAPKKLIPAWLSYGDDSFKAFALDQARRHRRLDWGMVGRAGSQASFFYNAPRLSPAAIGAVEDGSGGWLVSAWREYGASPDAAAESVRRRSNDKALIWRLREADLAPHWRSPEPAFPEYREMPVALDYQSADPADVRKLWVTLHDIANAASSMEVAVRDRVAAELADYNTPRLQAARFVASAEHELSAGQQLQESLSRMQMIVAIINVSLDSSAGGLSVE